ncbi:Uncharacterized protein FWK35_00033438, partial [Aphis craccivora]
RSSSRSRDDPAPGGGGRITRVQSEDLTAVVQSVVATDGVYKGQGRNQRELMTRAYWEFFVHVEKLQATIRKLMGSGKLSDFDGSYVVGFVLKIRIRGGVLRRWIRLKIPILGRCRLSKVNRVDGVLIKHSVPVQSRGCPNPRDNGIMRQKKHKSLINTKVINTQASNPENISRALTTASCGN